MDACLPNRYTAFLSRAYNPRSGELEVMRRCLWPIMLGATDITLVVDKGLVQYADYVTNKLFAPTVNNKYDAAIGSNRLSAKAAGLSKFICQYRAGVRVAARGWARRGSRVRTNCCPARMSTHTC